MEGAAFETALVIEEYQKSGMSAPRSITMSGGATASRFWQSLIADVTGLEGSANKQTDSPALGAAILASASNSGIGIAKAKRKTDSRKASPSEYYEYYQTKFNAYKEWRRSHK